MAKTYEQIRDYINGENGCLLLTTEEEFEEEKTRQDKSNSYIKLKIQCSCNNEFYKNFIDFKASKQCQICGANKKIKSRRLTLNQVINRFDEYGLQYISGEYLNFDSKIVVKCSNCENEMITTLRTAKNAYTNGNVLVCDTCKNNKLRDYFKTDFDMIKKEYEDNNCILLSKQEDYKNAWSKLKFIAKCGHEHTSSFQVFKDSKHHMCPKCAIDMNSGENAYNWNGGYDNEKIKFRKTYEFKSFVKNVFKRDNYTCQCCHIKSQNQKSIILNAHHLDGYNWCEEKRVDVDNGITLCKECHDKFHNIYGRGNNTKEQFEEFMILFKEGRECTYNILL